MRYMMRRLKGYLRKKGLKPNVGKLKVVRRFKKGEEREKMEW